MGVWNHIRSLSRDAFAQRCIIAIMGTFLGILLLFYWVHSTNSLALRALTFLTMFDFANLITGLLYRWSQKQQPTVSFTFGFSRIEVLAVFTATLLTQFLSFFIIKEAVHHFLEGSNVKPASLIPASLFGLVLHFGATFLVKNPAYEHLMRASPSNWVQDTVNDLGSSLFGYIPLLSGAFLPGKPLNPLALVTCISSLLVAGSYYLIVAYEVSSCDPFIACLISVITIATLLPMTVYTGKVLLQTTPSHIIPTLDRCLREAATLDGVLEFRNEHFWTLTWGILVGTLNVRVRRDANEQTVLAEVTHRLSQYTSILNIQVVKEETPPLFNNIRSPHVSRSYSNHQINNTASKPYTYKAMYPNSSYDNLAAITRNEKIM